MRVVLVLAVVTSWACSPDAARTRACRPLDERWSAPAGPAPGLAGAALVPTADGGAWVDLAPRARGEHPALALEDGPDCAVATALVPAAPTGDPSPREVHLGPTEGARAGLHGLVLAGADPGADGDVAAWGAAFEAVDAEARALLAPSRADAEAAIAERCATTGGGVLVLVATGPGTPSGGGGLVLGAEAVSVRRLVALAEDACEGASLLVLVLDTSYVPGGLAVGPVPRTLVWTGSTPAVPEAPRLSERGPGALSAVLAAAVAERASACPRPPDGVVAGLGFAAWLFRDDDLRARLIASRWAALGAPALAAASGGGVASPGARAAIAAVLEREVPTRLTWLAGPVPAPGRCASDADCALLDDACDAAACTRFGCVAGACAEVPAERRPCDDGSPCTTDDACDARGLCVGVEVACDDGDPCTDDACEPAGCVSTAAVGKACDDGDPCTVDDACDADAVCVGSARSCDDGDPCTVDSCDPAQPDAPCSSEPAALACDDGDPCTFADQCHDQVCRGTRRGCDDGNDCTADGCDPATGACAFLPIADGSLCDDSDPCTAADRCRAGVCVGQPRTCDDGLGCTFDGCSDGVCTHLPVPGTCVGVDGCVPVGARPVDEPCLVCASTDRFEPVADGTPCASDGIACTADRCEAGSCRHEDAPDRCHDADGRCVGVGEALTECLVCAGGGIARPAPFGTACGAPAGCAQGACDGAGSCALPADLACCAPLVLACGDELALGPDELSGATRVARWSCLATALPGPERAVLVTAPCAGTMTLTVQPVAAGGVDATLLLDAAACPGGACSAAGTSLIATVAADQQVSVAVEAPSADSRWVLRTSCACDPLK